MTSKVEHSHVVFLSRVRERKARQCLLCSQSLTLESRWGPEPLAFHAPCDLTLGSCVVCHTLPLECAALHFAQPEFSSFLPPLDPYLSQVNSFLGSLVHTPACFLWVFSQNQVVIVYLSRRLCAVSPVYVHTCVGWLLSLAPAGTLTRCVLVHRTQEKQQSVRGTGWLPASSWVDVLDLISLLLYLLK